MVEVKAIDELLKQLLAEFGPSSAAKPRHYPFWHLATDGHGALWDLGGPREILTRPAGATPNLGELRAHRIKAGFPVDVAEALRHVPGLLQGDGVAGTRYLLCSDAARRHRGHTGPGP